MQPAQMPSVMERIDGILVANQIPKIYGCFLRIGGASFHVAGEVNLEAVREPERSRSLGRGTRTRSSVCR